MSNNLTFVYHTPFWVEKGIVVTSHAAVGRYVDSLAPYFSEIVLVVPGMGKGDSIQYSLESSNIRLSPLPHYHNIQSFWFHFPVYCLKMLRSAASWDILNVRIPTHLGFLAFLSAKLFRKKIFFVVVGEFFSYNNMSNYRLLQQKIVNTDSVIQDKLMAYMIRKSVTFTNGEVLFEKFHHDNNHVYLMRSSTISLKDINVDKKIAALHNPIRILTVAVISARKGSSLIPDILYHLREMGHNVEWNYVGEPEGEAGKQELKRMLARATELSISTHLILHGKKSWYELQQYYRDSDLFVLPTFMEGIPRVLLEAQAAGLPVVTTTVGGIPKAIHNGEDGILVSPGDPVVMVDAIEKIIQNGDLYCSLATNGLETARRSSLETETKRMLKQVGKDLNVPLV